jgi:hypothetical protein
MILSGLRTKSHLSAPRSGQAEAAIKMPRNAVFTTGDGGAVLGENGEIAE